MNSSAFITRVSIKNYKSIAACAVTLHPLTFLVGPNGAGKSNFLDVLRFVTDALRTSLGHALRERGGIKEVRRRSGGHPTHFSIRLDFKLSSGANGHYAFRIGARPQGGYEVQNEECVLHGPELLPPPPVYFTVRGGEVIKTSAQVAPAAASDRLYLVNASGLAEFRPLYDALSHMGFYSLNPDRMRDLQAPDAGELLMRDGGNITSVLGLLKTQHLDAKQQIEEYLSKVVPGVSGVDVKTVGPKETLEFRQKVAGMKDPWHFLAANMSDGTLRVLGILVALFQSGNGQRVPLVGIEEPEVALHPAAAGILLDSLRAASQLTQIVVTSHSPDLLDDEKLDIDSILSVVSSEGVTEVGSLDEHGRSVLHDHLYTAGELLRLDQLKPDPAVLDAAAHDQLRLFETDQD